MAATPISIARSPNPARVPAKGRTARAASRRAAQNGKLATQNDGHSNRPLNAGEWSQRDHFYLQTQILVFLLSL
jgi:hypothetical protein